MPAKRYFFLLQTVIAFTSVKENDAALHYVQFMLFVQMWKFHCIKDIVSFLLYAYYFATDHIEFCLCVL